MRETSVGLGVIQFVTTTVLVCLLVWLAPIVVVIAVVGWAIYHLVTTRRTVVARATASPTVSRSISALIAAGCVVAASVPSLLGEVTWFTVVFALAATVVALYTLFTARGTSKPTGHAMRAVAIFGVVLAVLGASNLWANPPVTLYGDSSGENKGTFRTIKQYQAELPCLGRPMIPANGNQELYFVDASGFYSTRSCMISDARGALPVVFVQAETAHDLETLFASGVIEVGKLDDAKLWVQRDGAVAVITSDKESAALAKRSGASWINLQEQKR